MMEFGCSFYDKDHEPYSEYTRDFLKRAELADDKRQLQKFIKYLQVGAYIFHKDMSLLESPTANKIINAMKNGQNISQDLLVSFASEVEEVFSNLTKFS